MVIDMEDRPAHHAGLPGPGRITDPLLRYVLVVLALVGTVAILYLARDLFILLFVAGIFSFLLLPVCQRLERWGWPLGLAASASFLLLVLVLFGVLGFLGWQYAHFGKDLPALQSAFMARIQQG